MEALYKVVIGFVILLLVFSCTDSRTTTDCDINKGACIKTFHSGRVYFEISPRPVKPMKRLLFRVWLEGIDYPKDRIRLFLSMPGMDMGENLVILKEVRKGLYEGTGIIVRCPSGKTVWRADMTLVDHEKVSFTFDLKQHR
jgi:hypothetical protein